MKLRDYQENAVSELLDAFDKKENACVVSPTGSGKTLVIKTFAEKLLEKNPELKICVSVHRLEILNNLKDVFEGVNVDFQTVQYLSRHPECQYDVWLLDESHHVSSNSYRQIIQTNVKQHFGFTATPLRGYIPDYPEGIPVYRDTWKTELTGLYSEELYTRFILTLSTKELIERKYISDYEIVHDVNFHITHTGSKNLDYTKKEIDNVIDAEECVAYINHTIKTKKAIVFCHAIDFATKVDEGLGEKSVLITSKTSKSEREQFFDDFRNGGIQILVNVDIFSEGVDVPAVDCVYLFRPTRSIPVYFQQIGRSLRLSEGKEKAIVYDYVNNYKRLGVHPKDVKLKDMILKTKFVRETCEQCGAYGVIEGKADKLCHSVPTNYTRSIAKWLTDYKDYYRLHRVAEHKVQILLNEDSDYSNDCFLDYMTLFHKEVFPIYNMPIIMNQYGRWEVMDKINITYAVQRKNGNVFVLKGGCKYSDLAHEYYLVEENLVKRETKRNAKVKI